MFAASSSALHVDTPPLSGITPFWDPSSDSQENQELLALDRQGEIQEISMRLRAGLRCQGGGTWGACLSSPWKLLKAACPHPPLEGRGEVGQRGGPWAVSSLGKACDPRGSTGGDTNNMCVHVGVGMCW